MNSKYTIRTRIKKDIVAEFLLPVRKSNKAIIICDGLPALPSKRSVMDSLSAQGYWVFHIRYRGTWESDGKFLDHCPAEDVVDVAKVIRKGTVKDLHTGQVIRPSIKKVFVLGASFGGAVALVSSLSRHVDKVVAVSPVVDWKNIGGEDPVEHTEFVAQAFGCAYRGSDSGWRDLYAGKICDPIDYIVRYDPKKILILHSRDDEIVHLGPVKEFVRAIGSQYIEFRTRGHMSLRFVVRNKRVYTKVCKFLKS